MKAILLCAGYAARLGELTKNTPKALLDLNGTTLLDMMIKEIETIEAIDEIYLITNGRFYDQFSNWEKTAKTTKKIIVINDGTYTNDTRLGALGDTALVINKMSVKDDVFLTATDNYFEFKLKDAYNHFQADNKDCIIVKQFPDANMLVRKFGAVVLGKEDYIDSFVEKPETPISTLGSTGMYFYTKETVKDFNTYISESNNKDAPGNFIAWLCKRKKVRVFQFTQGWEDIGTPEAYYAICEKLKQQN